MLPAAGAAPHLTGILAIGYAMVLVPLSLLPAACGLAGNAYLLVALVLSLGYLAASIRFAWNGLRDGNLGFGGKKIGYLGCNICIKEILKSIHDNNDDEYRPQENLENRNICE